MNTSKIMTITVTDIKENKVFYTLYNDPVGMTYHYTQTPDCNFPTTWLDVGKSYHVKAEMKNGIYYWFYVEEIPSKESFFEKNREMVSTEVEVYMSRFYADFHAKKVNLNNCLRHLDQVMDLLNDVNNK